MQKLTKVFFCTYFRNVSVTNRTVPHNFFFELSLSLKGHVNQSTIYASNLAGSAYGLKLMLYVNVYHKLSLFNANWGSLGANIRITNASSHTSAEHGVESLKVAPGLDINIAIERSFKFMLPRPYSNCDLDNQYTTSHWFAASDLFSLIHAHLANYTQNVCFITCYQRQLIRECNCTDANFFSLYVNHSLCHSLDEITCVVNIFLNKYNNYEFIRDVCLPLCPLECNQTLFNTKLTFTRLFGLYEAETIRQNERLLADFAEHDHEVIPSVLTAKESFVSLSIFYESLSYQISTESAKRDFVSLIASIGGNLGLFLGLSVFSLGEIVQVLIEIYLNRPRPTR